MSAIVDRSVIALLSGITLDLMSEEEEGSGLAQGRADASSSSEAQFPLNPLARDL